MNSQHVYINNNIVSIKKGNKWYPVNFQWISISEVNKDLISITP